MGFEGWTEGTQGGTRRYGPDMYALPNGGRSRVSATEAYSACCAGAIGRARAKTCWRLRHVRGLKEHRLRRQTRARGERRQGPTPREIAG